MTEKSSAPALTVAPELRAFLETEALPGLGLSASAFFDGLGVDKGALSTTIVSCQPENIKGIGRLSGWMPGPRGVWKGVML